MSKSSHDDDDDPYSSILKKPVENKLVEPEKETARSRKLRILKNKANELQ